MIYFILVCFALSIIFNLRQAKVIASMEDRTKAQAHVIRTQKRWSAPIQADKVNPAIQQAYNDHYQF